MSTNTTDHFKSLATIVGYGIGYLTVMLAAALIGATALQAIAFIFRTVNIALG